MKKELFFKKIVTQDGAPTQAASHRQFRQSKTITSRLLTLKKNKNHMTNIEHPFGFSSWYCRRATITSFPFPPHD